MDSLVNVALKTYLGLFPDLFKLYSKTKSDLIMSFTAC